MTGEYWMVKAAKEIVEKSGCDIEDNEPWIGEIMVIIVKHCPPTPTPTSPWRTVMNPMRSDGAFVCYGPDRVYEGSVDLQGKPVPRLPAGLNHFQINPEDAGAIVRAHNEEIEKLRALLRETRREHTRECRTYGNYQPPYEECSCGADEWNRRIDEVLT